ncbi:MAG: hypothetical protein ACREJO_04265 [Phycisphaerales bacterium]
MLIIVPPFDGQQRPIPARIRAAMEFLTYCNHLVAPCDAEIKGRSLTKREQAAYDAATEAVRLYLTGELDFGDTSVTVPVAPHAEADTPAAGDIAPPPGAD